MSKRSFAGAILAATLSAGSLAAQAHAPAPRQDVVVGLGTCAYNGNDAVESETMFCGKVMFRRDMTQRAVEWRGFSMRPNAGVGIAQGGGREAPSPGYTFTTRTTNLIVPVSVRASRASWRNGFATVGGRADVQVSCKGSYDSGGSTGTSECVDQGKFDFSIFAGGGAALRAMGRDLLLEFYLRQGFFQAFKNVEIKHKALEFQLSVPVGRRGRSGAV
jgi:hypothetical protein